MFCYLYILQSQLDGTYYVGTTQDVESRVDRHNQGRSKYTKVRIPWNLLYPVEYENRADAMRREGEIKGRKNREFIEELIRTSDG